MKSCKDFENNIVSQQQVSCCQIKDNIWESRQHQQTDSA